jgi:hypothetical protein
MVMICGSDPKHAIIEEEVNNLLVVGELDFCSREDASEVGGRENCLCIEEVIKKVTSYRKHIRQLTIQLLDEVLRIGKQPLSDILFCDTLSLEIRGETTAVIEYLKQIARPHQ